MTISKYTPVPNVLFDTLMKDLSGSALRVYLKILRNTYGWRDQSGNTKTRDWIAHSQFEKVGLSNRSISNAIEELLHEGLILVTDKQGKPLTNPKERKKVKQMYYQLSAHFETTHAKTALHYAKFTKNHAHSAQKPTQNVPATKDIFHKKYYANPTDNYKKTQDQLRYQEIMSEQEHQQQLRNSWRW